MESLSRAELQRRIRFWLILFMVALCLSGLTAIPLDWGSKLLVELFGSGTLLATFWPAMSEWLETATCRDYG